jgi:predicted small secreted protein
MRVALALLVVLAALAGCENRTTAGVGSPIGYADNVFVPGFGRVEAMIGRSSAAGGSAAGGSELQLRMDDGTSQRLLVPSKDFHVGDRVRVTREGHVAPVQP